MPLNKQTKTRYKFVDSHNCPCPEGARRTEEENEMKTDEKSTMKILYFRILKKVGYTLLYNGGNMTTDLCSV